MQPTEGPLDSIREAACLAHTIPGVALRIPLSSGQHLLVSHVCLGADLTPCQLRSALIVGRTHDLRLLTDQITGAEVTSGLLHLGGGLYERGWDGLDERWFTSTMDPALLAEELRACPDCGPFDVIVKPDSELGVSAVCVRAIPGSPAATGDRAALDATAWKALSACIVAELIASLDPATH